MKWYHGTSKQNAERILKEGVLKPGQKTVYNEDIPRRNAVYIANWDVAYQYALERNGVVLEVANPDPKRLVPDEDDVYEFLNEDGWNKNGNALSNRVRSLWLQYDNAEAVSNGLEPAQSFEEAWNTWFENVTDNDVSFQMILFTDYLTEKDPKLAKDIIAMSGKAAHLGPIKVVGMANKQAAKKPEYIRTPGFVIEVPQEMRETFFVPVKAPLIYWAFKNRPRVFADEKLIFTFNGKPMAEAVCCKVEAPGNGEGQYKQWHKVYWTPQSFKKFHVASGQPKKLYHISRRTNRQSILKSGLVPQIKEYKDLERKPGVFFFQTIEAARDYGTYHAEYVNQALDIWECRIPENYPVQHDTHPEMDDFDAWVSYEPLAPENLKVVESILVPTSNTVFPPRYKSQRKNAHVTAATIPTWEQFLKKIGGISGLLTELVAWDAYNPGDLGVKTEKEALKIAESELATKYQNFAVFHKGHTYPKKVWRVVTLPSGIESLNTQNVGIYWAWDMDAAESHEGTGRHGESNWLLEAEIQQKDIDWFGTLLANLEPAHGEDECEIRLKPGAKIKLISYRPSRADENSSWSEDPWVPINKMVTASHKQTASLNLDQFKKLLKRPDFFKNFSIEKVPGIGVTNGALALKYKGRDWAYLGFPLEALSGIKDTALYKWLQKSNEEALESDWDEITKPGLWHDMKASWEDDDEEEYDWADYPNYISGECHQYTLALIELTGYPPYFIAENDEDSEITGIVHSAVKTPDGKFLDHDGKFTLQQLADRYGIKHPEAMRTTADGIAAMCMPIEGEIEDAKEIAIEQLKKLGIPKKAGKAFERKLYRGQREMQQGRGYASDPGDFGRGIYWTSDIHRARAYGKVIEQVVRLENPIYLTVEQAYDLGEQEYGDLLHGENRMEKAENMTRDLLSKGYDGLVAEGRDGELEVVDYRPFRKTAAIQFPTYEEVMDKSTDANNDFDLHSDFVGGDMVDAQEEYQNVLHMWQSTKFPLTVYRVIALKEGQKPRNRNAGLSWSLSKDAAYEAVKEMFPDYDTYKVVEGQIGPEAVNWVDTFRAWLTLPDEQEVRLKPGARVKTQGRIITAANADHYDEEGFWAGEGGGASGILPVCPQKGTVCLAWRSADVQSPNCWGTIGGAIQSGMSPAQSAKAELGEETGYHGSMTLIPAYVFSSGGGFRYHNFIGVCSTEFPLAPKPYTQKEIDALKKRLRPEQYVQLNPGWETDHIVWAKYDEVVKDMQEHPNDYHPGMLKLFANSQDVIEAALGIKKKQSASREWLCGGCYHYALALSEIMPDAEFVAVDAIHNIDGESYRDPWVHVGLRKGNTYYDSRGAINEDTFLNNAWGEKPEGELTIRPTTKEEVINYIGGIEPGSWNADKLDRARRLVQRTDEKAEIETLYKNLTAANSPQDANFRQWFAGSKVVDKQGNPLPVYHGTRSSIDFEEFSVDGPPQDEDSFEGGTTSSGSGADPTAYLGAHFAEEPEVASQFAMGTGWQKSRYEGENPKPRVLKVYLRITNPKDFGSEYNLRNFIYQGKMGDEPTEIMCRVETGYDISDSLGDTEEDAAAQKEIDAYYNKYDNDQSFRAVHNKWLLENYRVYEEFEEGILRDAAYDLAMQAVQKLRQAGHDGIRYKNEVEGGHAWVVFDPRQIKSVWAQDYNPNDPRFTASLKKAASDVAPTQEKIRAALQAALDAWTVRIQQLDPSAECTPRILENHGTWGKDLHRNFADLNIHTAEPVEGTERDSTGFSRTSQGDDWFIAVAIYWDGISNEVTIRVEDSFLPDAWTRKGVYTAGLGALLNELSGIAVEPVLWVHHAREDEPWQALAKKFNMMYKNSSDNQAQSKIAGFAFKSFKKLWHVGDMNPASKRPGSLEGSGLSVSVNPEEWEHIAEIGGDWWELTKPGNRFLNFHRISAQQRKQIVDWGIKNNLVEPITLWRVEWYDEESDDTRYSDFESEQEARENVGMGSDERVYEVPEGLKPTPTLVARSHANNASSMMAWDYLVIAYAEDELDCDGVWWQDKLDQYALSAPRGVIFPNKLSSWKIKKVAHASETKYATSGEWLWAITPKGTLLKKPSDGSYRHVQWFKNIGLPSSGPAFDRIPRGRLYIFPSQKSVMLIREDDGEEPLPNDLVNTIKSKLNLSGYTMNEHANHQRLEYVLASAGEPGLAENKGKVAAVTIKNPNTLLGNYPHNVMGYKAFLVLPNGKIIPPHEGASEHAALLRENGFDDPKQNYGSGKTYEQMFGDFFNKGGLRVSINNNSTAIQFGSRKAIPLILSLLSHIPTINAVAEDWKNRILAEGTTKEVEGQLRREMSRVAAN